MHDMTASHLRSAFGGESMAHMRYLAWADKAKQDGFDNIGRLFTAVAEAERVHATNHFTVLRDIGGDHLVPAGGVFGFAETADNLQGAWDGEDFEIREMYPAYLEVAEAQQEKGAVRTFTYALEAEKLHRDLYGMARESVLDGKDLAIGPAHICQVCGHTSTGDAPPDTCPICGVKAEKFVSFA